LYPAGAGHPPQYPYTGGSEDETQALVPHELRQALAHQRRLFKGLPGRTPRFVAIDFTVPEDGFPPHDFGLDMFLRTLREAAPEAFEALHLARADTLSDRIRTKARPLIYGYGAVAAGAGAVPIPIVGVSSLAGILAIMLRALAVRYAVAWTPGAFTQFTGAIRRRPLRPCPL